MKKSDLLIEILSWIAIIMIIWFFVWINYEMKIESWDGMPIADKGGSQVAYSGDIIRR